LLKLQVTHLMKVRYLVGIGNKEKKSPFQKQMQKLRERIEREEDEDIKRELRKANLVTIIEDSLDY
jgi:ribosomal protein L7/L12